MRAVIDHLFAATPAHRLELEVYAINRHAIAVYERLGFIREGAKRDALFWLVSRRGEWSGLGGS